MRTSFAILLLIPKVVGLPIGSPFFAMPNSMISIKKLHSHGAKKMQRIFFDENSRVCDPPLVLC